MKPFRGTKWNYSTSNNTTDVLEFVSGHNKKNPNSMKSKNKSDKMIDIIKSSELMSKLEKFSDVWNDCPTVDIGDSIIKSEIRPKENRRSLTVDSASENTRVNKKKSIILETDGLNTNNDKARKNKRTENNEHVTDLSSQSFPNYTIQHSGGESKKSSSETKYDAKKADLKRKKAVLEQRQLHVDQKNIIKQALASLGGSNKVNKKIVFDNDEENGQNETELEESDLKTKRPKLFDDEDNNEDAKFDIDVDFKLNHNFEGRKGHKLLELQSKFASDSRFALDKRFYDSGSEEENDKDKSEEESNLNNEKNKQLSILESIVKQQIRPLSEIKKKSGNRFDEKLLLRFDPTREDHLKYVVNQQDPTKDQESFEKKKKKTKKTENTNLEITKPEVSKEKFVSVKEDLKEVLNKDSGFSLLNLFGPKEPENDNVPKEETQNIKKLKHASKNPFKYDSSDSEPEEETKAKTAKDSQQIMEVKNHVSWRSTFFFTKSDPRLQEAFEFLKCPTEKEEDKKYAEKRKILKDFVKNKYKNSIRKNKSFKKKLGGLKKKPFVRRKGKSSK